MSRVMFALWPLAVPLAGFLTNRGGYGLRWDIVLGLVGGMIFRALAFVQEPG